jgi:transposase
MKYMTYLESMTAKLFIKFMDNIIRNSTKKVFLVVDNLKVHHGKLVQAWLKEQSKKIELFFLPPYSPELNPDEYLNNIIKNKMQSLPQARSQDELNSNVQRILKQLQNDHSKIEKIFDHDKIKYAKVKVKQKNK